MLRKIINIDEEKCNGCGKCAKACHEGAIAMVNGKAKLMRDDYCDGLGDCLPECPTGAISFVVREALQYDEAAVLKNKAAKKENPASGFRCPGMLSKLFERDTTAEVKDNKTDSKIESCLSQWPVQIKLVNVNAPYFENSDILIAADCTAYAYGSFHQDFIRGRITLIGCPKLDSNDYSLKLTEIFKNNNINSVTLTRMEVPCCGGLEIAVKKAIKASGKNVPLRVATISADGRII